jgi:hypothetical protein
MPETTKTYANIEILQGADFELDITLDTPTANKNYIMIVRKDFTGSTDFGGSNSAAINAHNDSIPVLPYRAEFYETAQDGTAGSSATLYADEYLQGRITATDSGTTYMLKVNLYASWTETLDDNFDGYWEMVEKDITSPNSVSHPAYSRIAQGEIYVNNSASRLASAAIRDD